MPLFPSEGTVSNVVTKPKQLDPSYLLNLGMSFTASRTVLSAVELDLFTLLHDSPLTSDAIREKLSLHPRAMPDFVDALHALHVISRTGLGPSALYANTPESQAFLSRRSETFVGDGLDMCAHRLYAFWNGLTEALKTGEMQTEGKEEGYVFDNIYKTDVKMQRFLKAMISLNGRGHKAFAEKFDFSKYETLLDVGGGLGQLACHVARAQPHLRCTTMDLQRVEDAARNHVKSEGMSHRVSVRSGDFFVDDLVEADVITMGMILHDHTLERKKMLIRKAYDALPEGGALVAIEMLIDDGREKHVEALLMSLSMLIGMDGGKDFTGREFGEWVKEAGFKSYYTMELAYPSFAAVALK